MTADPFIDVLTSVVEVLDRVGVPYAVTGSVASSLYGEPHESIDIDLVVRMRVEQARRIARDLPRRFYCSPEMLVEAVHRNSMVNLIDQETSLKVDISVLAAGAYNDCVMTRRQKIGFGDGGPSFSVVSAEDVVLMKLSWRKESRSSKQWSDALGVVKVRGGQLDWGYLFQQARELGVVDDLTELRDEGGV